MRFEVRIQKVDLPRAVSGYIERRLHFSLSRFESRVRRVTVRIFDINGPRGGVDKCCRITAHLHPTETVVVEELDTDLFAAIDRATERVARTFTRWVTRMRDRKTKRESVRIVEESLQRPPTAPTRGANRRKRKWHVFNPEAEHEAGPPIM
jgi:putative sigma-54 modulation protein